MRQPLRCNRVGACVGGDGLFLTSASTTILKGMHKYYNHQKMVKPDHIGIHQSSSDRAASSPSCKTSRLRVYWDWQSVLCLSNWWNLKSSFYRSVPNLAHTSYSDSSMCVQGDWVTKLKSWSNAKPSFFFFFTFFCLSSVVPRMCVGSDVSRKYNKEQMLISTFSH